MSFELDLPREAVPPMLAGELRKLDVEAADAKVDDGLWTVTLKDGRTIQLWYGWASTYGFWYARFGGRNYTITYDRECDALRRVLRGEPPPEPFIGGSASAGRREGGGGNPAEARGADEIAPRATARPRVSPPTIGEGGSHGRIA